jgi:hypothetical protein
MKRIAKSKLFFIFAEQSLNVQGCKTEMPPVTVGGFLFSQVAEW